MSEPSKPEPVPSIDAAVINRFAEEQTFVLPGDGYLRGFPPRLAWQLQRRHPYYQLLWTRAMMLRIRNAAMHSPHFGRQHPFVPMPNSVELYNSERYADHVIARLGVLGQPEDPEVSPEQLQLAVEDERAAIRRARCYDMVLELMRMVDVEHAIAVSELLTEAVQLKHQQKEVQPHQLEALINQKISPWFMIEPADHICHLNPRAPVKKIRDDINDSINRLQEKYGIQEQRTHHPKLSSYLHVWDLREGWANGRYDITRRMTYREIVEKTSGLSSLSTARNHYQAAFREIIGLDYSPERRVMTMGLLHYSASRDKSATRDSSPMKSRTPKAPTAMALDINLEQFAQLVDFRDEESLRDDLIDVKACVEAGKTPDEIAAELDISVLRVHSLLALIDGDG